MKTQEKLISHKSLPAVLREADELVGSLSEETARRLSRRRLLGKGLRGAAAVVAAGFAGSFGGMQKAFAVACTCNGISCGLPLQTGKSGCKSDCTVCKKASGCGYCIYNIGYWVCCYDCCGHYGHGYYLCTDCKCPNCANACTQQSGCLCNNCTSPADIRKELAELQATRGSADILN